MYVFMSTPTSSLQQIWFSDPQTYTQALKYDHRAEWELEIMEEIESLLKNETWMLHTLPSGHNLVINKWVFKINVKSYGTIEQSKAHLKPCKRVYSYLWNGLPRNLCTYYLY